jgi:thiol-disulfide isomerase/thioredoxin
MVIHRPRTLAHNPHTATPNRHPAVKSHPEKHYFPITTLRVDVGEQLPDFGIAGGLAAYAGRPLLINLFSAHCPPCIREIPVLNAFMAHAGHLQLQAISVDDEADTTQFRRTRGLAWQVIAPGEDYAYQQLGIEGIPAFLLVDAQGRLLASTYSNQLADTQGEVSLAGLMAWTSQMLPTAQGVAGPSAIRQR